MKMPTPMKQGHTFSKVPAAQIERSAFDRSHALKTTFNAGDLVPIYTDEVLPGDTFTLSMNGFARLATPLKPIMDNLYMDTFFFFVPYRLVWANFVKMMGEQNNPGDSTSFVVPQSVASIPASGHLADYFGWPVAPTVTTAYTASCLYHRAYYKIYNEWFRDQNLQTRVSSGDDVGDGPSVLSTSLLKRGKRHDYFTSCLPWPQKGTAVSLPLGSSAPVITAGAGLGPRFKGAVATNAPLRPKTSAATADVDSAATGAWVANEVMQWDNPNLIANLTGATSATINELRLAFQVQKLLERDARGGTRYTEVVKAHFRVTSPDARLQRTEYLGGGSAPLMVSPIAQNSASAVPPTAVNAQGNLSGIGTSSWQGHGFSKSFTEHGLLIGLISVRADLTYQQGLDRMWSRSTRYDFYWPALSHIGEQAVLVKEIFATGVSAADNAVFGYQERYAEYRYKQSRLTGKFRSDVAGPLDVWHLSQDFAAAPTLNSTFIEESPPVSRVVAVTTEPQFILDAWFNLKCARPMPVFGVPGLIDHF